MSWPVSLIQKTRESFVEAHFPQLAVDVDDVPIVYFVIPHEWAKRHKPQIPPAFAMRMTPPIDEMRGKPIAETTLFAVSDTVHHLWRPHYIRHEVQEYVSHALEHPHLIVDGTDTVKDGCLLCSQAEWIDVQEAFEAPRRREYLNDRRQFFADLLPFASMDGSGFSAQSIIHFEQSLRYWQTLTLNA